MAVRKREWRGGGRVTRKEEMKAPNISGKTGPKEKEREKSKKAPVIAQEIKIARLLANNDKKVRDKVLKRLNKWLTVRSESSFVFTKADFMSLWKGLFYCVWLSDKMLIQEELAESVSKLVYCLKSRDNVVLYTSCALQTLASEWFGIDQYRLDKFSMLVRRILRQTFVVCKNQSWNMEWITEISQMFTRLFLHVKSDIGFKLHLTEIYLEELAKISDGNIPEDVVHELVKPFVEYLITTCDERQMRHIMRHVFRYLIFQSNIGLDHMEKFNAWKAAGFPCAHLDDVQKLDMSDMKDNFDSEDKWFSETEKPLDPRAGRVDVELPQIPFNAAKIAELLATHKFHPLSTATSRRQLLRLIDEYTELSQGRMPLGIKTVRKSKSQKKEMDSRKAALRLIKFEKNLLSDKKRKREKSEKPNCDQIDDSKNEGILNLESNDIDSESELIDSTVKVDLQDTDTNIVPFKKQKKCDSTCDISGPTSEIIENKKKLQIKTSKKSKAAKIKLIKKNNKSITDRNVKHKTKKAIFPDVQISDDANQYTSISSVSEKIPLKINKKSITKKKKTKNKHQETPLKNETCQKKKQINSNYSFEKKKVIFGLSRNTAQHTSEYLQQVRKSPGIPFDANKKPLASVLKMSPIPSLLNPFYKEKT